MGGNAQFGVYKADNFDIMENSRERLCYLFEGMIGNLNYQFDSNGRDYIWDLTNGLEPFLSGSTKHLWEKPFGDLLHYKQIFGDIDIFVDKEIQTDFCEFIEKRHSVELSQYFTLINSKRCPHQLITLFEYNAKESDKLYIQVDFEFVEFKVDKPTEYSRFSHCASWEDQEKGIKGVFHKYLIIAGFQSMNRLPGVIVTNKSNTENFIVSSTNKIPVPYSFSVGRGLRKKYELQDCVYFGQPVWKEIQPNNRRYYNNLEDIFAMLFNENDNDLTKFWSFIGLLDLYAKYFSRERIKLVYIAFLNLMYGEGSQMLYRDWKKDYFTKEGVIDYFEDKFKYLNVYQDSALDMIQNYYKEYTGDKDETEI